MKIQTQGRRRVDGYIDAISNDRVSGWAADLDAPSEIIEVVIYVDDREVARVPADRLREDLKKAGIYGAGEHGFVYFFPKPLEADLDWQVTVRFADDLRVLKNGERLLQAQSGKDPKTAAAVSYKPVLVSSSGRSGSTFLMKLLLSHPAITGGNLYPFEVRPAAFYSNAFRVLTTASDSAPHSIRDTFDVDPNVVTLNPFNHKEFRAVFSDPDELGTFFRESASDTLKKAFVKVIQAFYARTAGDDPTRKIRYFAEKCDISRQSRQAMRKLYGDLREIILVRDLRDVVCSYRLFFTNQDHSQVIQHLAAMGNVILEATRRAPDTSLVVRYEDLIVDRDEKLSEIATFLDLPDTWNDEKEVEQKLQEKHGTSKSAESSIGRWQSDLTAEEQQLCNEKFDKYLKAFGYK
jgi:hypothetical protein